MPGLQSGSTPTRSKPFQPVHRQPELHSLQHLITAHLHLAPFLAPHICDSRPSVHATAFRRPASSLTVHMLAGQVMIQCCLTKFHKWPGTHHHRSAECWQASSVKAPTHAAAKMWLMPAGNAHLRCSLHLASLLSLHLCLHSSLLHLLVVILTCGQQPPCSAALETGIGTPRQAKVITDAESFRSEILSLHQSA